MYVGLKFTWVAPDAAGSEVDMNAASGPYIESEMVVTPVAAGTGGPAAGVMVRTAAHPAAPRTPAKMRGIELSADLC